MFALFAQPFPITRVYLTAPRVITDQHKLIHQAPVMLLSGYGASRLGRVFPRSSTTTVAELEGISNFATIAASPRMALFGKGQSL
jgi:hypothetical protein